jgi:hypothetical protein
MLTGVKLAKATSGSTIHNIAEAHHMEIGIRRISSAGRLEAKVEEAPLPELAVPVVQVASVALAVRGAPVALERGPAVVELEHVPVVAELERGQAVAELELDRVAVQLKTKSATGARRRGQVPVPRVEDLGAEVVEITHAPAAAEAATAWAAAG